MHNMYPVRQKHSGTALEDILRAPSNNLKVYSSKDHHEVQRIARIYGSGSDSHVINSAIVIPKTRVLRNILTEHESSEIRKDRRAADRDRLSKHNQLEQSVTRSSPMRISLAASLDDSRHGRSFHVDLAGGDPYHERFMGEPQVGGYSTTLPSRWEVEVSRLSTGSRSRSRQRNTNNSSSTTNNTNNISDGNFVPNNKTLTSTSSSTILNQSDVFYTSFPHTNSASFTSCQSTATTSNMGNTTTNMNMNTFRKPIDGKTLKEETVNRVVDRALDVHRSSMKRHAQWLQCKDTERDTDSDSEREKGRISGDNNTVTNRTTMANKTTTTTTSNANTTTYTTTGVYDSESKSTSESLLRRSLRSMNNGHNNNNSSSYSYSYNDSSNNISNDNNDIDNDEQERHEAKLRSKYTPSISLLQSQLQLHSASRQLEEQRSRNINSNNNKDKKDKNKSKTRVPLSVDYITQLADHLSLDTSPRNNPYISELHNSHMVGTYLNKQNNNHNNNDNNNNSSNYNNSNKNSGINKMNCNQTIKKRPPPEEEEKNDQAIAKMMTKMKKSKPIMMRTVSVALGSSFASDRQRPRDAARTALTQIARTDILTYDTRVVETGAVLMSMQDIRHPSPGLGAILQTHRVFIETAALSPSPYVLSRTQVMDVLLDTVPWLPVQ
eukprot:gene3879-7748_t